jgi:hypothetical protein
MGTGKMLESGWKQQFSIYCPMTLVISHKTAVTVYMYYCRYMTRPIKRRVGTAFMRLTLSLVVIRQHASAFASASFRRA